MEQSTLARRGLGLRGVDPHKVSPGYTLFAHLTSPGTVNLIDNHGQTVSSAVEYKLINVLMLHPRYTNGNSRIVLDDMLSS